MIRTIRCKGGGAITLNTDGGTWCLDAWTPAGDVTRVIATPDELGALGALITRAIEERLYELLRQVARESGYSPPPNPEPVPDGKTPRE